MSTVTEIEAAIEKLPPADFRELQAWIQEYQAMVRAAAVAAFGGSAAIQLRV